MPHLIRPLRSFLKKASTLSYKSIDDDAVCKGHLEVVAAHQFCVLIWPYHA